MAVRKAEPGRRDAINKSTGLKVGRANEPGKEGDTTIATIDT
jgi:hypothetical protein